MPKIIDDIEADRGGWPTTVFCSVVILLLLLLLVT